MHLARIAVLLLPIALCSCAAPTARMGFDNSQKPRIFAWDGSGHDPNRPRVKARRTVVTAVEDDTNRKREQVFNTLSPYSAAWWAVHDEIEAYHDKRLGRKLVICSSCLRHSPRDEVTGTIPAH
jgi:hypothetical protein